MAKIGIIGARGNMGTRYGLITKALGHEVIEVDLGSSNRPLLHDCDGIIIATPTATHFNLIMEWGHKPILCEKPISKHVDEIDALFSQKECKKLNVRMINQYEYYILKQKEFEKIVKDVPYRGLQPQTFFNYYKHGNDGLIWDCINIIGLSGGSVQIHGTGFIWECMINNIQLCISEMDRAYIWNIRSWLNKFDENHEYIVKAHKKCHEMEQKLKNDYKS
jgi:hypothetical protein